MSDQTQPGQPPSSSAYASKRLRIMVADDVTETRRSTRLMLTLIPNVEIVAIAKNGREAVELARQHKPDIALMDVNMPQMNGLQAIEVMLSERPEMACIILSAERDTETLLEAMAVGARGYLTKPFTSDQLIEAVARISHSISANNAQSDQVAKLRRQRDIYMVELANEYVKQRRTDDKALLVYEELAARPDCDLQWLMSLAMIYVLRKEWGKLKALAIRLENLP
ncbi:MAG: response regulator transcription factor [Chloroflexi bacterium]|nr:response regulator transcription factor [Chloroflexota bacterium]